MWCRLHWSQPVQCSGGVVITALQHISPPWQLTAHQQQQVVSVLQPGERGAAKSDGGGNASHSCGPEDVCLVGLDIAASALDHFCLENAAFAEINSEACVCANSPCRVAMSETEPMQHFVAVKVRPCARYCYQYLMLITHIFAFMCFIYLSCSWRIRQILMCLFPLLRAYFLLANLFAAEISMISSCPLRRPITPTPTCLRPSPPERSCASGQWHRTPMLLSLALARPMRECCSLCMR